jgi:hypothetical protein
MKQTTKNSGQPADKKEITMDLPDVKDIPGQEHIHPPKMKAFSDTTISSDDEEGKNIPGLHDEEDDQMNDETTVSSSEADLLERTENSTAGQDDLNQTRATLDNRDEDGELLNEEVDASGSDLDVPGAEDDDANEEIGEEDEENNSYSLGGDRD